MGWARCGPLVRLQVAPGPFLRAGAGPVTAVHDVEGCVGLSVYRPLERLPVDFLPLVSAPLWQGKE